MTHTHDDGSECDGIIKAPLHSGLPVLVRLINGQDIMGTVYILADKVGKQLCIEAPIVLISRTPYYSPWVPMSDSGVFPINTDHVVFIAPLSKEMTNKYMGWIGEVYGKPDPEPVADDAAIIDDAIDLTPDAKLTDDQRARMDFLGDSLVVKGKPN